MTDDYKFIIYGCFFFILAIIDYIYFIYLQRNRDQFTGRKVIRRYFFFFVLSVLELILLYHFLRVAIPLLDIHVSR